MSAVTDLDRRLDELFADPPWREPAPLPRPESGDATVDGGFHDLDRVTTESPAIEHAKRALLADGRPCIVRTAVRWLDAIHEDRPRTYLSRLPEIEADEALRTRLLERCSPAHLGWPRRLRLVESLLALLPYDVLLSDSPRWLASSLAPMSEPALGTALLTRLPSELGERARALDVLSAKLDSASPLLPVAAVARAMRDGAEAMLAIATALDGASDALRGTTIARLCREASVDFDKAPEWVDALFPRARSLPMATLALADRLSIAKTAEPTLRAMMHMDEETYWKTFLDDLRRIDDATTAPRLEAMAATLPEEGPRVARSKAAVLALAKKLRRKRTPGRPPTHETLAAAGTDGGPLLLVSADVAGDWRGVPADWDPNGGDSDYDRACAASDDGVGGLSVASRRALAISSQAASVVRKGDALYLVLAGTALDVEAALSSASRWRQLGVTLDVGDGGARLLDAARTVARAEGDAIASVPLAAGTYVVREHRPLRGSTAHILALCPATTPKRRRVR